MITTYQEARAYLESFIHAKTYEKITVGSGDQFDPLNRMRYLLTLLGNPERAFPLVVVSGTSGKGSTAYLTAQMLACAGYKTGLMTSPHLQKINERMQIAEQGVFEAIADEALISLLNEITPTIDSMVDTAYGLPSYYEILSAVVFLYFSRQRLDIAVLEVGMEGKFEATNLASPLVFVLTNISLDHTAILGNTIGKIAEEATHRITYLQPTRDRRKPVVVTGVTQASAVRLVADRAALTKTRVMWLGKDFMASRITQDHTGVTFDFHAPGVDFERMHVMLLGKYQATNAALAIACVMQLHQFGFTVGRDDFYKALAIASFPGRFEIRIGMGGVHCIVDGAHNPAKMRAFCGSLHALYARKKKVFLVAFKKDKDAAKLLRMIDKEADVIILSRFTSSVDLGKNLGMEMDEMREQVAKTKLLTKDLIFEPDSRKALDAACVYAERLAGVVVVTGSMYFIGEVDELLDHVLIGSV